MMVERRGGFIVFTSASGAVHYVYGPAYGAHKAGMDKFAADMAVDFKEHHVAVMSIWMGALLTDRLKRVIASDPAKYGHLEHSAETPELTGHIIWALYNDPKLMDMSGQTVIGAEIAVKYGIKDQGGRQPRSYRETHKVEPRIQYPNIIR
jgi:NADP-dependent 3-hydroxy acid dehydrogenase YdfG